LEAYHFDPDGYYGSKAILYVDEVKHDILMSRGIDVLGEISYKRSQEEEMMERHYYR